MISRRLAWASALIAALIAAPALAAVVSTFPQPFQPGFALQDGSALNTELARTWASTQTGLTAHSGGGQTSGLALTATFNQVAVVAAAADSVVLPAAVPGRHITVANSGANNLAVFPAGADTINAVTTAYTIPPNAAREFDAMPQGAWFASAGGPAICTGSFSTNAVTCNGTRGLVTTGSLTTAHSAAATAQVVTNSSVTASSLILCTIDGYSGSFGTNGNPTVACVPTAATITMTIVNAADTNALSGTVTIGFEVLN